MSDHLELLKTIDPATDPEQFYYVLTRKMLVMNSEDRETALQWSAGAQNASALNLACHTFAESTRFLYSSDFFKVLSTLQAADELFKKLGHKGGQMAVSTILCTTYRSLGQLDKAENSVQKALKLAAEVPHSDIFGYFHAVTYYQAGEINGEIRNYETAISYFEQGLPFSDENLELKGRLLNGMGVVLMNLGKWDESLSYLERSLRTVVGKDNIVLESKILADIGMYYFRKKEYERSFSYQEKSLKMRIDHGMHSPVITNYIRLAELCFASGKTDEALNYAHLAVEQAFKLKATIKLYEAHHILSSIYEQLGDIEKAYEHFKQYNHYKEEVHSQEVMRKVEQLKNEHKVESAQQEKEIFRLKNVELKAVMHEIEESFRYAQRIQTAILPPQKFVEASFPDSFVLFKPKDIVSGDFYWMETIEHTSEKTQSSKKVFIAAVDCTGHGVPGAMVSMVGHNCLNKTVHEFGLTKPSEMLDKLTELVEGTFVHKDFHHEKREDEIKDGMDISLCCIDIENKQLEWAGANNPLWILRNGELKEMVADKQPIGKFDHRHPFTNHQVDLLRGDCIYLFTDGYADQFGGPAGKKFKYKQLKDLLVSLSGKEMNMQKETLHKCFEDWKGKMEQVDDVLLIGFRIE